MHTNIWIMEDCGSGIGRVTKNLLLRYFNEVSAGFSHGKLPWDFLQNWLSTFSCLNLQIWLSTSASFMLVLFSIFFLSTFLPKDQYLAMRWNHEVMVGPEVWKRFNIWEYVGRLTLFSPVTFFSFWNGWSGLWDYFISLSLEEMIALVDMFLGLNPRVILVVNSCPCFAISTCFCIKYCHQTPSLLIIIFFLYFFLFLPPFYPFLSLEVQDVLKLYYLFVTISCLV